jgi:O-antigen/teichoic acid export membrane protein
MVLIIFTLLITFVDLGLHSAIIQKEEKLENIRQKMYSSAFWTIFIFSILIGVLLFSFSFEISRYILNLESMSKFIKLVSLTTLFYAYYFVVSAKYYKELNFKKISLINIASMFLSIIISVFFVLINYPMIALLSFSISNIVFRSIIYFFESRWIPNLDIDFKIVKKLLRFGITTSGTSVVNGFTSQYDYFIVGRFLGPEALGIYTIAFNLSNTIKTSLTAIISKVVYPIYSKMQNDKTKIVVYYNKVVFVNTLLITPILILLVIYSPIIINRLYGSEWLLAKAPLQILAFASIIQLIVSSNTTLLRSIGEPFLELKVQGAKFLIFLAPLLYFLTVEQGIIGASLAILLNAILSVIIAYFNLSKVLDFNFKDLFRNGILNIIIHITIGLFLFIAPYKYIFICLWVISTTSLI